MGEQLGLVVINNLFKQWGCDGEPGVSSVHVTTRQAISLPCSWRAPSEPGRVAVCLGWENKCVFEYLNRGTHDPKCLGKGLV